MSTQSPLQDRLDEVNAEIEQIQNRLSVAHGLGDSNSAQGISSTYNDNIQWTKRLDALRLLKRRLTAQLEGKRVSNPFINIGTFR